MSFDELGVRVWAWVGYDSDVLELRFLGTGSASETTVSNFESWGLGFLGRSVSEEI